MFFVHVLLGLGYTYNVVSAFCHSPYKQQEIADAIDRDKSVISREIGRNCDLRNGTYKSDLANRKYKRRIETKAKRIRFTPEIQKLVDKGLEQQWSPEQISNFDYGDNAEMVSHERIYQYVIKDKKEGGSLHMHLRCKKKYRKRIGSRDKRGNIKDSKKIRVRGQKSLNKESELEILKWLW